MSWLESVILRLIIVVALLASIAAVLWTAAAIAMGETAEVFTIRHFVLSIISIAVCSLASIRYFRRGRA